MSDLLLFGLDYSLEPKQIRFQHRNFGVLLLLTALPYGMLLLPWEKTCRLTTKLLLCSDYGSLVETVRDRQLTVYGVGWQDNPENAVAYIVRLIAKNRDRYTTLHTVVDCRKLATIEEKLVGNGTRPTCITLLPRRRYL